MIENRTKQSRTTSNERSQSSRTHYERWREGREKENTRRNIKRQNSLSADNSDRMSNCFTWTFSFCRKFFCLSFRPLSSSLSHIASMFRAFAEPSIVINVAMNWSSLSIGMLMSMFLYVRFQCGIACVHCLKNTRLKCARVRIPSHARRWNEKTKDTSNCELISFLSVRNLIQSIKQTEDEKTMNRMKWKRIETKGETHKTQRQQSKTRRYD